MSTSSSEPLTRFDIDLTFESMIPDEKLGQSELVAGKIFSAGTDIVVECSNLDALLGLGWATSTRFAVYRNCWLIAVSH